MQIENKLAIHELLGKVAIALDQKNLDAIEECFAADATMTLTIAGQDAIPPFEGRDAIMALMKGAVDAQTDERRHVISNICFHEEGDDMARVVSYLTLCATENGEVALVSTGIYNDQVVRDGENWRLANRNLHLDRPY